MLHRYGEAYAKGHATSAEQQRAMRDIQLCRTAALGGHLERCLNCEHEQPAYNSCRNRHCPKCQALAQARWVEGQMARVLPVRHFHVVFTLPSQLRGLAQRHPREVYALLLRSAADTLLTLGRDSRHLGAELGLTAVLHTWNRELALHPHVHCIVTAGGLSLDGDRWVDSRPDFLFPVKGMGQLMRGKFLDGLVRLRKAGKLAARADSESFGQLVRSMYRIDWNVYSKAPFASPEYVFRYLAHYTHRTGISNRRLLTMNEHGITFRTRGQQTVTLPPAVFIGRFLSHVLPTGFVKIRHYGLMANGGAVGRRECARQLILDRHANECPSAATTKATSSGDWQQTHLELTGVDLRACPRCGNRALKRLPLPRPKPLVGCAVRGPPVNSEEAA